MFSWSKDRSPERKSNGTTHWVDGKNVSRLGLAGFLSKTRGTVFSCLFSIAIMGTPWWAIEDLPKTVILDLHYLIVLGVSCLLVVFLALIHHLKRRTLRSLSLNSGLQQLAHETRAAICDTIKRLSQYSGEMTENDFKNEDKHLRAFTKSACSIICDYFQKVVDDDRIVCSIRLLSQDPHNELADSEYVTYGRAGPHHSGREDGTQAIKRSEGLPAYFLNPERACQGVLFVHDSTEAEASDICARTRNNTTYYQEVKYRAVSPMYGWNGEDMDLLGLLYLTSPNPALLNRVHIDLYRFSADTLAGSYTSLFALLKGADNHTATDQQTSKDLNSQPEI